MTQLLYRDDQEGRVFEARVVTTRGPEVVLDRTLFYPEGGGQPSDQGTLTWPGGDAPVTHVRKEDGEVVHVLAQGAPLPAPGTVVEGHLDGRLRFRHMQRHSAEHLLAQAFLRVNPAFGVQAVSMRGPECTIDLTGNPGEDDARAAEAVLMDVIALDLPIRPVEVDEDRLSEFPLRRPPQVRGRVRLVTVEDRRGGFWEVSACGGTHVASTARVAPVVVMRLERVKGGLTRVVFRAGEEATEYLSGVYRDARALALTFSTGVEGLTTRVNALRAEAETMKSELTRARAELARRIVEQAPVTRRGAESVRVVSLVEDELLQPVLAALLEHDGEVGVVTCASGRCGMTSTTAGRSAGVELRALLGRAGGRGGGKPEVAQGQAEVGAWRAVLDAWLAGSGE
ncbi:alanyl-tRNA editing protein [Deinococcus pimensis]|uniref:alanyl-tRNA editing protein n=1 Tax=Deinococcus pimensis TaxID=309888 RepID=UPI0004810BC9|nr:alanyl-tRNA editing protein [Deinococcus pimensis]